MTSPIPSARLWLAPVLLALLPLAAAADPPSLPAWEQLTPEQREQLVAPIRERWNAEPDERARLLERATRWQQMSPDQRHRAHKGMHRWERMSPEQREHTRALYKHMRSLDEAGRRELKARWRRMTPEEREAWVEAHPTPRDD